MQNFRVVDEDLNVARPVSYMLDICSGCIFKLFLRYSLASERSERDTLSRSSMENAIRISPSLPKCCNFCNHERPRAFPTLLTPVLTIFTDFLSAVVTSEIAQILSYGGGFFKWKS